MEAYDQHHDFGAEIGRKEDSALIGGLMFASIAGVALALQFGVPARPNENIPWVREIRYRRHGHAPPCDHGYDHDERDGKCYPSGTVPLRFQSGGYYPLELAAAGARFSATMAQTSIFETGFVTRRARCHGSISKAVRGITIAETATTKCDSAASGGCADLIPRTGHAFIAYSARALL